MSVITCSATPYGIRKHLVVRLPQNASSELPSRSQVMVQGTINGHHFQAALEPDGRGSHWLDVDTGLRQAANVRAGESVELSIEPVKNWPEPFIPDDWQVALDTEPGIKALWDRVTPMARWEWLRWIGSSANPETRARHVTVSCSKLRGGLRRPCCFNRSMCCVPEVSKNGVLLDPATHV